MKLIIASNNQGKIREFKQLLLPLGYEVISQVEAGICLQTEETGNTFEENARLKAQAIFEITGLAVIADDSGLCVDAIAGEPGVYSANYDIPWLLERLNSVAENRRNARFVCCICYIDKNGEKLIFGECEGRIGFECRGENGFGYDPVFLYGDKTFAQLTDDEKNEISHRGKALRELVKRLQ
jgi:XTP/dITP diphosphohydrolase